MTKIYLLFTILFCALFTLSAQKSTLLVTPEWLSERLSNENIKIFHVDDKKGYDEEHIKGAQFLSWKEYAYEDDTHAFDLPTDDVLKEVFESKGVNDGDIIVLYSSMNPMMSRVYLTLDYLGFSENTYLLDGGLTLWKIKNGATSNEVPSIERGAMTLNTKKDLIATLDYVKKVIDDPGVNIVDGRAPVYYQGIEAGNGGKSRKGHIKGAKTIPFTSLYDKNEDGSITFVSQEKLEKIFDDQNLKKNKQIVLYCHIGMQLSTVYVASKILGYQDVKVYDGSFYEWGPDESLPIELD